MKHGNPLLGVLLFLIVGAGLGLGFNALRPRPLPWVATARTAVKLEDLSPPVASAEPAPTASAPTTDTASNMSGTDGTDGGASEPPAEKPAAKETATKETASKGTDGTQASAPETTAVAATADSAKAAARAAAIKKLYADLPESDVPIDVSLTKAKDLYDRGGLLVLDARDLDEYADGHIMGAIDAPYDDKVGDIQWLIDTAKDPRPILCYCNGGECELGLDLATEISRTGHKRVMVLTDGYPGWRNAGYPIAPGRKP